MSGKEKEFKSAVNAASPSSLLSPQIFFDALHEAAQLSAAWKKFEMWKFPHFYRFINELKKSNLSDFEKKGIIKEIFERAQQILNNERSVFRGKTISSDLFLIGQQHDNELDLQAALEHIEQLRKEKCVLVLEREGDLHPNLDPPLISISKKNEYKSLVFIVEDELHSQETGKECFLRPGVIRREKRAYFGISERSQIIGRYAANLMAENPNIPITIIFGQEHIDEIHKIFEDCLNGLSIKFEGGVKKVASQPQASDHDPFSYIKLQLSKPIYFEYLSQTIEDYANDPNYLITKDDLESFLLSDSVRTEIIEKNTGSALLSQLQEFIYIKSEEHFNCFTGSTGSTGSNEDVNRPQERFTGSTGPTGSNEDVNRSQERFNRFTGPTGPTGSNGDANHRSVSGFASSPEGYIYSLSQTFVEWQANDLMSQERLTGPTGPTGSNEGANWSQERLTGPTGPTGSSEDANWSQERPTGPTGPTGSSEDANWFQERLTGPTGPTGSNEDVNRPMVSGFASSVISNMNGLNGHQLSPSRARHAHFLNGSKQRKGAVQNVIENVGGPTGWQPSMGNRSGNDS